MKALVCTDNSWPKPHNWLFKLTFAFIFGILSARFLLDHRYFYISLFIFISSIILYIFLRSYRGVLVYFIFLSLGSLLYLKESEKLHACDKEYSGIHLLKIERILKQTENTIHAKGLSLDTNGKYYLRAILYIKKDSIIQAIIPGDYIIAISKVQPIENTTIPFAFQAKNYYETKGISHACYLTSKSILFHKKEDKFNLYKIAYEINQKIVKTILRWSINKDAREVLIALLTGSKDYLTEEIRTTYSDTGTIHVLAVSGLHTGLIYVLFASLLALIFGSKLRILRGFLLISILWFYALFTGLSPSVVRAATMFTFIEFGQNLKRKTGIYHSLCLSAVLLLSTSPLLLFDIGFQLSYAAVYGIVSTSNFFNKILSISDNFLLKKISEILSVSLAAQLFTFPFTVFYFSKFPTWFFIANLYAIPLVTLTLYLGFPIAIISMISDAFDFLGKVPAFFITVNNFLNNFIVKLPFSIIEKQFFDAVQFTLLLLTIVLLFYGIVNKKKRIFLTGIILLVLFEIYSVQQSFKISRAFTEIYLSFIQEKPLLLINLKGKKIWIFSANFQKIKTQRKTLFSKYLNKWQMEESDLVWNEMPEKIEIKERSKTLFTIHIHNHASRTPPKPLEKLQHPLKVILRSSDGKEFILNRDGYRILVL
ncbi:ComEC/Rec2 family competence protein [Thermaurantimonas aggregans]|uniref:ComEC/Rec2 family competence protein n=1 Tax=Thermaurantimonas aggregans TaxID=2173829 RepID=UPI000F58A7AD|nr:ComEC/Rec2 family competence protein [Thermaurantimonas aggregans]MCX8148839.1 competence protein ComEC family protein [Thermaurantimonas aggregans]